MSVINGTQSLGQCRQKEVPQTPLASFDFQLLNNGWDGIKFALGNQLRPLMVVDRLGREYLGFHEFIEVLFQLLATWAHSKLHTPILSYRVVHC